MATTENLTYDKDKQDAKMSSLIEQLELELRRLEQQVLEEQPQYFDWMVLYEAAKHDGAFGKPSRKGEQAAIMRRGEVAEHDGAFDKSLRKGEQAAIQVRGETAEHGGAFQFQSSEELFGGACKLAMKSLSGEGTQHANEGRGEVAEHCGAFQSSEELFGGACELAIKSLNCEGALHANEGREEAAKYCGASDESSGKVEQLEEAAGQGGNLQHVEEKKSLRGGRGELEARGKPASYGGSLMDNVGMFECDFGDCNEVEQRAKHGGSSLIMFGGGSYGMYAGNLMFDWDPGAGTEVNFAMINGDARYGGVYINFDKNGQGGELDEPGEVLLPTLYRHTPLLGTLLCAPPPGPVEVLTDHADQGGGAGGMAPPYVKAESPKLGYKDMN